MDFFAIWDQTTISLPVRIFYAHKFAVFKPTIQLGVTLRRLPRHKGCTSHSCLHRSAQKPKLSSTNLVFRHKFHPKYCLRGNLLLLSKLISKFLIFYEHRWVIKRSYNNKLILFLFETNLRNSKDIQCYIQSKNVI